MENLTKKSSLKKCLVIYLLFFFMEADAGELKLLEDNELAQGVGGSGFTNIYYETDDQLTKSSINWIVSNLLKPDNIISTEIENGMISTTILVNDGYAYGKILGNDGVDLEIEGLKLKAILSIERIK